MVKRVVKRGTKNFIDASSVVDEMRDLMSVLSRGDVDPEEEINTWRKLSKPFLDLMSFNSRVESAMKKLSQQNPVEQLKKVTSERRQNFVSAMLSLHQPKFAELAKLSPIMGVCQARSYIHARDAQKSIRRLQEIKDPVMAHRRSLDEQYGEFGDVVYRAERAETKERGNEVVKRTNANRLWHGVHSGLGYASSSGRRVGGWSDWKIKKFDFAKAHGLGTDEIGLGWADFFLKRDARKRGAETLKKHQAERNHTWWYDNLNAYNKERFDLIQHYGGGDEGVRMADEKMQQRADKRRRLAESHASINHKRERIDFAQKYPAFKKFFLDSKNSTKDIHAMAESLHRIERIPIAGKFLTNPYAIAAGSIIAAYKFDQQVRGVELKADKDVANLSNIRNYYGDAPKEFAKAAARSGLNEVQTREAYGKLEDQFGPSAMRVGVSLARATKGMPRFARRAALAKYGINPAILTTLDEVAGYDIGDSEARESTKLQNVVEATEKYGASKSGNALTKLMSIYLKYSDNIGKEWMMNLFRDMESEGSPWASKLFSADTLKSINDWVFSQSERMNEIDQGRAKNASAVSTSTTNSSVTYINRVDVHSDNVEEMEQSVREKVGASNNVNIGDAMSGGGF